ncbi:hypothetical protein [Streptomyces mutabilis]|uniref:hypothetical protein n=1 Tax=Streptomyces mutabilis TaxID=67332 RepID=UPI00342615DE
MGRMKPNKTKRPRSWAAQIARVVEQECPDCISSVLVRRLPDGSTLAKLQHDSTCPHWGAKAAAVGIDRHRHNILHGVYITEETD